MVDRNRLAQLLVSARDYVFANELHADIAQALNLDPDPLTTRYRWVERGELRLETVHVTPLGPAG